MCPTTAPRRSLPTSNILRAESSTVVKTRFADNNRRSFVPIGFLSCSSSSSAASLSKDVRGGGAGRYLGVYTAYAGGGVCNTSELGPGVNPAVGTPLTFGSPPTTRRMMFPIASAVRELVRATVLLSACTRSRAFVAAEGETGEPDATGDALPEPGRDVEEGDPGVEWAM